jgi:hypothetical protein
MGVVSVRAVIFTCAISDAAVRVCKEGNDLRDLRSLVRALAGLTADSSGAFRLGICFKLALHINYSTSNANVMQKSTSKRNLNVRVSLREYKALELSAAKDDRSITEVIREFLRSLPEYQQLSQEGIEQDAPE